MKYEWEQRNPGTNWGIELDHNGTARLVSGPYTVDLEVRDAAYVESGTGDVSAGVRIIARVHVSGKGLFQHRLARHTANVIPLDAWDRRPAYLRETVQDALVQAERAWTRLTALHYDAMGA
ncbi:hypothetical protein ABTY61_22805 [Kitasatospora sp. NPDC096128]|uniref:hypothetical protein n=1 Tax=Kitasatospora sp. NPDC096128 TaxID=3155547 RepID=UPI003329675E